MHLVHLSLIQKRLCNHDERSCRLFSDLLKKLQDPWVDVDAICHVDRYVNLEPSLDTRKLDDRYTRFADHDDIFP